MKIEQAKEWIERAKEHIRIAKGFGQIGMLQKMRYHLNKAEILLNGAEKCMKL